MTQYIPLDQIIDGIVEDLHAKLGARGKNLSAALARARHRLPRRIYHQAMILVKAEPLARHPRLRQTLNGAELASAATEVSAHLAAIDLSERRKTLWLGALGGLVFNLILMGVALVWFLTWRGSL